MPFCSAAHRLFPQSKLGHLLKRQFRRPHSRSARGAGRPVAADGPWEGATQGSRQWQWHQPNGRMVPPRTLMSLVDTRLCPDSPSLILGLPLGVVGPVDSDTCEKACIHHDGIIQNIFTALKILCWFHSFVPTVLCRLWCNTNSLNKYWVGQKVSLDFSIRCYSLLGQPNVCTILKYAISSVQLLSRVRLHATPWTAARQASLSITNSQSLLKLRSIEWVMPSNLLFLCLPLLPLPSIFPSIGVFSNESALLTRWLKYWSFSFSISPSNEYSGLISFRIGWLDLNT